MRDFQKSAAHIFCALLIGCAHNPYKTVTQPSRAGSRYLGEIAIVNLEKHFVLIDTGTSMLPAPAGAPAKSQNENGETAQLKISADRKPPFISADIVSGDPKPGDKVYQ